MEEKKSSPEAASNGAPQAEVEEADEAERSSQPGTEGTPDTGPASWNPVNVMRVMSWALVFGILADVVAKGLDTWYLAAREPGPISWALWYKVWMERVHPVKSALVSGGVASLSVFLMAKVNPPEKIARLLSLFRPEPYKWALVLAIWSWAAVISYAAWAGKGVYPGPLMLLGDVMGSRWGASLAIPAFVWLTGYYVRVRKDSRKIRQLRESLRSEATRDVLVGANLFGLAAARFSARIFEKIGIRGEEELAELVARAIEWLTHTGSL